MGRLNLDLLKSPTSFPDDLYIPKEKNSPERIVQFGSGNFLRGFADWMIDEMNDQGLFDGKVVIVQSVTRGMTDKINAQNGLYTLYLRGLQNGALVEKKQIIRSVSRTVNAVEQFDEFLRIAENPDIRFCISNTTETGIAYLESDLADMTPPESFPGKLAVFLYHRFQVFSGASDKGLIVIPCELIEKNGKTLKELVLRYATKWGFPASFSAWVENACEFVDTLVDRIVTGYPKDEIDSITKDLGYEDALLDTAEIYHSWVIEGANKLEKELPLKKAGFNVTYTDSLEEYRNRKVRILNGAHTMMVLAAYLAGKNTVKECLDDQSIALYLKRGLFSEIIPTIPMPEEELTQFANDVLERFQNPFIKHYLLSIALNSVSKWKTRVLPSVLDYIERYGAVPPCLTFSLSALIAFYQGTERDENGALIGHRAKNTYPVQDSKEVLDFFQKIWAEYNGTKEAAFKLCISVLSHTEFWGMDLTGLPGFTTAVSDNLYHILTEGTMCAMGEIDHTKPYPTEI